MNNYLRLLSIFILSYVTIIATAQEETRPIYFVDGFHGGVYGHYPIKTYTDYMSDLLAKHPGWSMCLEIEPETWDTVMVKTPEAYAKFAEYTKSNRVEYTNPAYAQAYMYNISGESIIRQFKYGIRKLNSHFPWMKFETYAVEEPCFTSSLPMILTQFGFKYAVIRCPNTCWGGYPAAFGGELVNWIGPDGTSILSVPRSACEELEDSTVWQTKSWNNSDEYIKACFDSGIEHPVGMCYQDAGWTFGPWLGYGESAKTRSQYTTWKNYFENIANPSLIKDWRFSQEDVLVSLVWGSQVAQTLAREVRKAEDVITESEKLTTIAFGQSDFKPDQSAYDEAWRTLLLSQHHDCWIVPYNRLNSKGSWADNVTIWTNNTITLSNIQSESAISSMEKVEKRTSKDATSIRIFNTTSSPRKEIIKSELPLSFAGYQVKVKDAKGEWVKSQIIEYNGKNYVSFCADVPSFGYATYKVLKLNKKATQNSQSNHNHGNILENSRYKITFDPKHGGVITSLISKELENKEFANSSTGYSIGELRGFFYDNDRFISSKENEATISFDHSVRGISTAVVTGTIAGSQYIQTITIREDDAKIAFNLKINWKGNPGIGKYKETTAFSSAERAFYNGKYKLNVFFPVSLENTVLYKDAPFDVCKSNLETTEFDNWGNIKHDIILHWIDLSEKSGESGLALMTDHTTSYTYAKDHPLALTVQYSGSGLWGRNYPITRPTEINFCIMPHAGSWSDVDVQKHCMEWQEPLIVKTGNFELANRSFLSIDKPGYEISASYLTEEGILIRIYNASSDETTHRLSFDFDVNNASFADLNETSMNIIPIKKNGNQKYLELSMPRFSIQTITLK